jgi:mRNA-degrading endonuclease RelE of RelBE toxin-antitoxin system
VKIRYSRPFGKEYEALDEVLKALADKAIDLFIQNPHHPSLRVKKMRGHKDIWEARISQGFRFTFSWENDICWLRHIGGHDVLRNP